MLLQLEKLWFINDKDKQTNKFNLGKECPCCKVDVDLIPLHTISHHTEEPVSCIYESVIVCLLYKSYYMCSTHSTLPSCRQLIETESVRFETKTK